MRIDLFIHQKPGADLMAISAAFQAQLDRATSAINALNSKVADLEAQLAAAGESGPAQDAEDTAALDSTLTGAGVAEPTPAA